MKLPWLVRKILPSGYGIQRHSMFQWRMVRRNGNPSTLTHFTIYGAAIWARQDYLDDMRDKREAAKRWEDVVKPSKGVL